MAIAAFEVCELGVAFAVVIAINGIVATRIYGGQLNRNYSPRIEMARLKGGTDLAKGNRKKLQIAMRNSARVNLYLEIVSACMAWNQDIRNVNENILKSFCEKEQMRLDGCCYAKSTYGTRKA